MVYCDRMERKSGVARLVDDEAQNQTEKPNFLKLSFKFYFSMIKRMEAV